MKNKKNLAIALLSFFLFIISFISSFAQSEIQLPQSFVDVSYPQISGKTIEVSESGDFQAALNKASPGDEIVLQAGSSYIGNFRLPKKEGNSWTIIRTSGIDEIPQEGQRVNLEHAASMPKIISPNTMPAISTEDGAHHYRFVGIEITTQHSNTEFTHTNVVALHAENQDSMEKVPHHIIFDRTYIHGTPTGNVRRGVAMNGANIAVVNSHLSDFHEIGADSQAIAGWSGPGPFKITNNYLEGAGENIIFGGSDPKIEDLVPSDIEIIGNHFYKPLSWKENDPSYAGIHWSVKNLFELKNAKRVLIDRNLFENNWADAQIGTAILLKSANQDGKCPWCVTEHVTFSSNVVKSSDHGLTINAAEGTPLPKKVNNVAIKNVLFEDVEGRLFQIFGGVENVRIEHVTGLTNYFILAGSDEDISNPNFVFRDNIVKRGQYGIFTHGEGKTALDRKFAPYIYSNNLIIVEDYSNIDVLNSIYPEGTSFAQIDDVGFADWKNGDFELSSTSPFRNAASDGTALGADASLLRSMTESITGKASIIQNNNIGTFEAGTDPFTGAAEDMDEERDKDDDEDEEEDFAEDFLTNVDSNLNQNNIQASVASNAPQANTDINKQAKSEPEATIQLKVSEPQQDNKFLQFVMVIFGILNLLIYSSIIGIEMALRR